MKASSKNERLALAGCAVAMISFSACAPASSAVSGDGAVATPDGGASDAPLDAWQDPSCGTPCPGEDTFWDPYVASCLVIPSIDPPGDSQPVCGCDGHDYPSAAIAARRGHASRRDPGRCGDVLSACDDRMCTSAEYCDHTLCEGSGTCRARAVTCDPPTGDAWSCGCDGEWYESDCTRRMSGVSGSFDDEDCGPIPALHGKRVFITSTVFRGGEVGGLVRADAECQARADAASLGGSWIAFLVDGAHGVERIPGDTQWSNLAGDVAFADRESFETLTTAPHAQFAFYEDGRSARDASFWLGTNFDERDGLEHCAGWTSLGSDWGAFANIRPLTGDPSWQTVATSEDGCGYFPGHSLLCVER